MVKKLLLPLLCLLFANVANAKTVTLLVSLDPKFYPQGIATWFHDYAKYPDKLEATFRAGMASSGYEIKVVQNATRYDLYEALHSSENAGVFWVSHEAPISYVKGGIEIDPELVDAQEADVKDVFKQISPGIQWVSLVACDSDLVINWLKGQGTQEPIALQGFDKTVDANKALQQSMDLSKKTLADFKNQPVIQTNSAALGYPIMIHRTLSDSGFYPSVTLELGGAMIAAFPEVTLKSGESTTQDVQAYLTGVDASVVSQKLTLVVQSGFSPLAIPAGFQMGSFNIDGGWDGASWKTFVQANGTPFGVTQQLLLYDGTRR